MKLGPKVLTTAKPAGYLQLGDGSNGDVFVLYERGAMSYSEKISLARFSQGVIAP